MSFAAGVEVARAHLARFESFITGDALSGLVLQWETGPLVVMIGSERGYLEVVRARTRRSKSSSKRG